MANLSRVEFEAEWDWASETYVVQAQIRFMFGATMYNLTVNQRVTMPTEYANVADQVEHVFIDIAGQLGKLNNAQMTLEADEMKHYL